MTRGAEGQREGGEDARVYGSVNIGAVNVTFDFNVAKVANDNKMS